MLVVAAVAVAATLLPIPGGPLDESGGGVGLPLEVGGAASIGYSLRNDTRWELEVREVRADAPVGVEFLGALFDERALHVGALRGFPKGVGEDAQSLEGAVVKPHSDLSFVGGFRVSRAGDFRIPSLEVEYRLRVAGGVGPLFREDVGPFVGLCARRGSDRCDPPDPEQR